MEQELEDNAAPILCRSRGGDDELAPIGSFSMSFKLLVLYERSGFKKRDL